MLENISIIIPTDKLIPPMTIEVQTNHLFHGSFVAYFNRRTRPEIYMYIYFWVYGQNPPGQNPTVTKPPRTKPHSDKTPQDKTPQ